MNTFPEWMGDCPRHNAPWGAAELEQLICHIRLGNSLTQTAQIHGRTINSILCKLQSTCVEFASYYRDYSSTRNINDISLAFIFDLYDHNGTKRKPFKGAITKEAKEPGMYLVVDKGYTFQESQSFPLKPHDKIVLSTSNTSKETTLSAKDYLVVGLLIAVFTVPTLLAVLFNYN